uniref:ATP synthase F0 subunit 8 n=1 Tax=Umbonium thomasi TaxID=307063 RepID=A0A481U8M8_9VEST|nr:ATP synthase F0 subunit 8 [Umbonium thomasi]QBI37701.1 ATP synthase F0 subunit 8 [Umbonium thomasi]
MPQLAPVNWLFLFIMFWSLVALGSTLIWWSFKAEYTLPESPSQSSKTQSNLWSW